MNNEYDFWAALVIGFLSAGHCLTMCGGIVGAFSTNLPLHHRMSPRHKILYILSYNIGRITSYVCAGALIGYSISYFSIKSSAVLYFVQFFAGFMLVAIGLYLANVINLIRKTEVIGKFLWPIISPFARRFVPFKSPLSALPFGIIWGWLPCGLVYSVLTWSAASGSAVSGGLIMLGFGLGTLPAMISIGYFSQQLNRFINKPYVRFTCAFIIIGYGLYLIYNVFMKFIS